MSSLSTHSNWIWCWVIIPLDSAFCSSWALIVKVGWLFIDHRVLCQIWMRIVILSPLSTLDPIFCWRFLSLILAIWRDLSLLIYSSVYACCRNPRWPSWDALLSLILSLTYYWAVWNSKLILCFSSICCPLDFRPSEIDLSWSYWQPPVVLTWASFPSLPDQISGSFSQYFRRIYAYSLIWYVWHWIVLCPLPTLGIVPNLIFAWCTTLTFRQKPVMAKSTCSL